MKTKWMEDIFCKTQEQLKDFLHETLKTTHGESNIINKDGFLYAKGTHPVLLVAHLDTVHKQTPKEIFYNKKGTKILSFEGIGGDDRCGVIIILEILKSLNCSVVFCEDEETGCIGAKKFCKEDIDLDVNYAVEFDRKGNNDYVFYKDYNADFEDHIKAFGFKKAHGSCSDISHIAPAFEIEAVNISSGYYNPHTTSEYVDFEDMTDIINRCTDMISTKTKKFKYIKDSPKTTYYYGSYWNKNYTYDEDTYRPLMLKSDQVELQIKGIPVKFDHIWIDVYNKIYRDDFLEKPLQDASIKIINGYNYATTYFALEWRYKSQIMSQEKFEKIKQRRNKVKKCAICGKIIYPKDDYANKYGVHEGCQLKLLCQNDGWYDCYD